ncbi:MAG: replication-associated recombination protein A, partial [Wenyingzhuangia sp.]
QVYILNPFEKSDMQSLLQRAIEKDAFIAEKKIVLKEIDALLQVSSGDARKLLNIFELIVASEEEGVIITNDLVLEKVQRNVVRYDKTGEQHYDIISAFIKSIRGSDPNAAVYWLARMVEGGEDVKFIARRMLISASEDIGNANPTALIMATSTFQAVATIGYPEARILLSQCAIYLANSAKSNASYEAINKAVQLVKQTGDLSVPLHLRNAPTKLMKDLNYGKEYKYSHAYEGNFVAQEFMPDELREVSLYRPGVNARENEFRKVMRDRWGNKYDKE